MSTALDATQAWLLDAVTAPRAPDVLTPLAGTDTFSAAAGLGIYRRAYLARTGAAMRTQFPALCHRLGQTLFDDFAATYLRRHPPQSYTLHDLGRRFADHLADERPDRHAPEPWVDFMIELARFERIVFELFDAPGAEHMTPARPDTPDDRLRLQPAVRLARFAYNVAAYHHAVRRDETPTNPVRTDQHLAVLRVNHIVQTIPLQGWESVFLTAMADGGAITDGIDAIACLRGISPEMAMTAWRDAPAIRAQWITIGLFIKL